MIDEYLSFDIHTLSVCSKVHGKLNVLKKSSYLFDLEFRIILFKLFVQSKYDYCSTILFDFSRKYNATCLEKSFNKGLKRYLNINLNGMELIQQYEYLKQFKLLPLKLRFFQNFLFFAFSLHKENKDSVLLDSILNLKRDRLLRFSSFHEPKYHTSLYKFSFLSIVIRLLNSFIFSNLELSDISFRSMFNGNDCIKYLYLKYSAYWT